MKAIQVTEFGGPETLVLRDIEDPAAQDGLLLVSVEAAGINFADTMQTQNQYVTPTELPHVPGGEVVGRTPDGRRVVGLTTAGYAERALVPQAMSAELPDAVPAGAALALLVQGTTAWHLLKDAGRLTGGETVLVHAGAGGVGNLLIQLAKHWSAGRVVGTASTPEKRQRILDLGADAAVDSASPDLAAELKDAAGERGFDVILEMVGGDTFTASLEVLAPFGRLITYGAAGGTPAPEVSPASLMVGSKSVIGFYLGDYLTNAGQTLAALTGLVVDGSLKPVVGAEYPLADARQAHEDLLARRSEGKLILVPDAS